MTVFDSDDSIGKLSYLVVVRNHYDGLRKLLGRNLSKA